MKYKIEILQGKGGYYWLLSHRNGNVLASSEIYSSKYKATQTATALGKSFKKGLCKVI